MSGITWYVNRARRAYQVDYRLAGKLLAGVLTSVQAFLALRSSLAPSKKTKPRDRHNSSNHISYIYLNRHATSPRKRGFPLTIHFDHSKDLCENTLKFVCLCMGKRLWVSPEVLRIPIFHNYYGYAAKITILRTVRENCGSLL